jgi:hypothetical protein
MFACNVQEERPGVKTLVWFVLHKKAFYVSTEADSWKVEE